MDSGIESTESSNGSINENPFLHDNRLIFENSSPSVLLNQFSTKKNCEFSMISDNDNTGSALLDDRKCFCKGSISSCPELLEKVNNISKDQDCHNKCKFPEKYTGPTDVSGYFSASQVHLNAAIPKQYDMNCKSNISDKFYENKKFSVYPKNNNSEVDVAKLSSKLVDEVLPLPEGCKLKINFPNHDPLRLNIRPDKSFHSNHLDEVNSATELSSENYYGPLAVLPYESRELQRKFKHYRHKLKQMKDLSNSKPKEKKLRTAAAFNNTELVSFLLCEGVNPNSIDSRKRTPLHIAASKGYTDVVKILLQHGANPNQKDVIGNTALHLAACTSHIETVTLLLKAGTDAKEPDNSGFSPLHLANSRLRLMQKDVNPSSIELREQVLLIIEMMEAYMKCSGNMEDAETLASLTNKLSLTDPSCHGEDEFKSLLNSLQDLTLSKSKID